MTGSGNYQFFIVTHLDLDLVHYSALDLPYFLVGRKTLLYYICAE